MLKHFEKADIDINANPFEKKDNIENNTNHRRTFELAS